MNLFHIKDKVNLPGTGKFDVLIYLFFLTIAVAISRVILFINNAIIAGLKLTLHGFNFLSAILHDVVTFTICVTAEIIVTFKLPFFTSVLALYVYELITGINYLTPLSIFFTTISTKLLMVLIEAYNKCKDSEDED